MAKKSKINRNEHRKLVVAKYAARRAELKATIKNQSTPPAERELVSQFIKEIPSLQEVLLQRHDPTIPSVRRVLDDVHARRGGRAQGSRGLARIPGISSD